MDARRAPEGIGEGHGADELCNLAIDGRATSSTASGLPVPEGAEALPVPANDGLRLNDMERFAPPRPPLREPHPEEAIELSEPRSLRPLAQITLSTGPGRLRGNIVVQAEKVVSIGGLSARRRSRASCCRSAKFSRTKSERAPSAALRAPSRANTRGICRPASLLCRPLSSVATEFWPTTGERSPVGSLVVETGGPRSVDPPPPLATPGSTGTYDRISCARVPSTHIYPSDR